MTKFLIFSLFFHTLLITFFNFKKFYKETKAIKTINIAYVENKIIKKESPQKKNKNTKVKKNTQKKKQDKKPEIKKNTAKKDLVQKPKKIKKKKDPIKKNIKQKNENNFDDMLKNLAKKELVQELNTKDDIDKKIKNLSQKKINNKNTSPDKKELLTIVNVLMMQINNNWIRPPGIKNIENLTIKLVITLDPNGYVTSISIPTSTDNMIKEDKLLRPYLDSALRAIKKSSPFEGLEKHRYNIWKKININFMPFEANR